MTRSPSLADGPPLTANAWLRFDYWSRWLEGRQWRSVLEVGPGVGAVGARLASTADRYCAIEMSDTARERAAVAVGPSGTVVASLDDLDPALRFDLLVAFEVLEHIDDDVAALTSWVERLEPGATVIVSMPAWQERFGAADRAVGHLRRYSPDDARALLTAAGLEVNDVELYGFPVGYALEWGRNRLADRHSAPHEAATPTDLSATSGMWFQPRTLAGRLIRAAMFPARSVQRFGRGRGVGVIARASVPLA